MFNPFKWWSEYQLRKLSMQHLHEREIAAGSNAVALMPYETLKSAIENQTRFMIEYFSAFKTTEIPTSTTMRDVDEFMAEQSRAQLQTGVMESMRNAAKVGAFPEVKDMWQALGADADAALQGGRF